MEQSTRSPTIHKEITTMEFCDQLLCSNSHKVRIKHTHTNNNVLVSRLKWSVMYWIKIHWELTDVVGSLAQGRDSSVWASLCLASQQTSTLSSDKNIIIYSNELLEVVPEESSVYWPRYNHVMVTIASERYLTIYQDRLPWRLDMLHTPYQSTLSSSKNPWTAIGPTLGRNGPLGGQPSWRVVLMAVSDMMKVELDYCCAGQFNNWQDGSVGDLNQWLAMRLARWDLRSSQLFCSMVMNESGVLLWNNQTRRSVPMILRDDGPMRKTIAFIGLPLQWKTDHGVAAFQSCPHILRSQIR